MQAELDVAHPHFIPASQYNKPQHKRTLPMTINALALGRATFIQQLALDRSQWGDDSFPNPPPPDIEWAATARGKFIEDLLHVGYHPQIDRDLGDMNPKRYVAVPASKESIAGFTGVQMALGVTYYGLIALLEDGSTVALALYRDPDQWRVHPLNGTTADALLAEVEQALGKAG